MNRLGLHSRVAFRASRRIALPLQTVPHAERLLSAGASVVPDDVTALRARLAAAASRAERLARANRAMHASLAAPADLAALDGLLGQVLSAIVEHLGEDSGGIWLHDATRDLLILHLSLEDGRLSPRAEADHPGATLLEEGQPPSNRSAHNMIYRTDRAIQFGSEVLYEDPSWAPYAAYFRALGVRCLLSVPLFAGTLFLGCITVRARHRDRFTADEVEFAQLLANQASLALHVCRAAQAAQDAAVARERAAELARANTALREGLAFFAEGADIDSFLRHQLRVIADQFGSIEAGLWVADEAGGMQTLTLSLEDGEVVDAARSRHPLAGKPQPVYAGNPIADSLHRDRKPILFLVEDYRDPGQPWFNPTLADRLEASGTRAVLMLPLVVGDLVIGSFSHRLPSAEPIPPARLELAQALAGQSALALHLSRLAAAERAAAVAREREAAATQRAEVLARANAAIRSSLDRLAEGQSLDAFLGEVVIVCARELGAVGAGIWVRRDDSVIHDLAVSYEDGEVRRPDRYLNPARPNPDGEAEPALSRGEIKVEAGEALTGRPWYPAYRDYLEARGIVAIASVPLFIGERWVGTVVLRYTEAPEFPQTQRELAHALANQIALALELTRLADAARDAAVAAEREAAARTRAEKLAAANRLLRESAERLGAIEDIDAFLGQVLLTITQLLAGHSATVWTHDHAARLSTLRCVVEGGRAVPAVASSHPNARGPRPEPPDFAEIMPGHGSGRAQPFQTVIAGTPALAAEQAYFRALGVASLVSIPMVLNDEHLGTFTIRLVDDRPLLDDERELIQALANQAAVALHLTRLAEAARDAAVAGEREAAARTRAEKLAAANRLLRESAERLGAIEDIDAFLGQVLLTITQLLAGHSATVWTHDHAARLSTLRCVVEGGRAVPAVASSHPNARGPRPEPPDFAEIMPGHGSGRAQPFQTVIAGTPALAAEQAYFRALGVASLVSIPMVLNDEHLGTFTIRLVDDRPLLDDERELIQALANQAAVALHLTRLAEQARDGAVAQARAEAATQRAADLARANAALAQSTATLSAEGNLDAYLAGMLRVLLEQMDSDSGSLWRIDEDGWYRLYSEVVGGVFQPLDETGHPGARSGIVSHKKGYAAGAGSHARQAQLRQAVYYPDVATAPEYDGEQATRAYLLAQGVRAQLIVPLFSGERHLGAFSVRYAAPRALHDEQIELAQALGNQAALAIEMNRLAAEARDTAVAREREAAAKVRADKIAAANRLLLGPMGDTDAFLGRVLLTINELLGGHSATVWTVDHAAGEARLRYVLEAGQALPAHLSRHPNALASAKLGDRGRDLARGDARPFQSRMEDAAEFSEEQRAYFEGLGLHAIVTVPIVLNQHYLGAFTIRLTDDRPLLEEDRELVQTLANQAAIALHLTQAAEEERRAALSDERNRLAREIHDTLAQGFAAIALQLQAAERAGATMIGGVAEPLRLARRLAHDNLIEARRSLDLLKSGSGLTLAAGLARLIDSLRRAGEQPISSDLAPSVEPPAPVAHELLRIAQEALANALRHGQARTITLRLQPFGSGGLRLRITDDGVGFDPDAGAGGFGLAGMRERAAVIGADLTVISEPGAGTQVVASWGGLDGSALFAL